MLEEYDDWQSLVDACNRATDSNHFTIQNVEKIYNVLNQANQLVVKLQKPVTSYA